MDWFQFIFFFRVTNVSRLQKCDASERGIKYINCTESFNEREVATVNLESRKIKRKIGVAQYGEDEKAGLWLQFVVDRHFCEKNIYI